MTDKEYIRQTILRQLNRAYKNAVSSASAAHEAATNEESKAENKYDTRGLEASYLAEGQSRRAAELEEEVAVYEQLELVDFLPTSAIRLTALVTLEDTNEHQRCFFIGPISGGLKIDMVDGECVVVTPNAPLGSALIGKRVGDEIVLNAAGHISHYDIVDVC